MKQNETKETGAAGEDRTHILRLEGGCFATKLRLHINLWAAGEMAMIHILADALFRETQEHS